MEWNVLFFVNSFLLGIGLAMDAFSVSLVNGLNEPNMPGRKVFGIASLFAFFQGVMPLLGWLCVHTILTYFQVLEMYIPWIALALLLFIGGKMLVQGIKGEQNDAQAAIGFFALFMQGIATSIDALSVGFTVAEYSFVMALVCSVIIMTVTLFVCIAGLEIGKKVGEKLSNKATIFGGALLIFIGIEIFCSRFFA